jgi:hypothetical protein
VAKFLTIWRFARKRENQAARAYLGCRLSRTFIAAFSVPRLPCPYFKYRQLVPRLPCSRTSNTVTAILATLASWYREGVENRTKPKTVGQRIRYVVVAVIALFLVWWMLRLYVL